MSGVDVLGQMITSHDFVAVDQPLYSAIELWNQTLGLFPHMPSFVKVQLAAAQTSGDLIVKRAAWLILLVVMPEVQVYALSVGHPEKTPKFLAWCTAEAEKLFSGAYQAQHGDEALSAFVANACNSYESF
jgi:hypothetical protein